MPVVDEARLSREIWTPRCRGIVSMTCGKPPGLDQSEDIRVHCVVLHRLLENLDKDSEPFFFRGKRTAHLAK